MNIIALSIGLTPVPPRPAGAVGRIHSMPPDRDAERGPQQNARPADDINDRIIESLREYGPSATPDLALLHKLSPKSMRARLLRLAERGLVKFDVIAASGGRVTYLWSASES
jgi:hypothetical protein